MKVAVLVDRLRLATWQARALAELRGCDEIIVYNCINTGAAKRQLRHLLYYLLNLFTIRNPLTRPVSLDDQPKRVAKVVSFEAEYEGSWQRLPSKLLRQIAEDAPHVILKFGMGLLRIPPASELAAPVLSYHHGNPVEYRGRPAGFYELLQRRESMGQIVQRLSNKLDAGSVLAFGESKVFPHSYRTTLVEAFAKSPLLINGAVAKAVSGRSLPLESAGKVYKLPSNLTVAGLFLRTVAERIRRILYGAFFEKIWQVSLATFAPDDLARPERDLPPPDSWRALPCPRGYSFIADPFFAADGKSVLVEGLRSATGKGEILSLSAGSVKRLSDPSAHFSYPLSFEEDGISYLVPETSLLSPTQAFRIEGDRLVSAGELRIPGRPRLLDPTLFRHGGNVYLFANRFDEGPGVLRLWHSGSLFSDFEEHPASPIRVSNNGSRMGGEIIAAGAGHVRIGQQWRHSYGDGLILFSIDELSPAAYRETPVRTLSFDGAKGPHTMNFRGGEALFDWYRDRYSPLAGFRRVRGRLHFRSG